MFHGKQTAWDINQFAEIYQAFFTAKYVVDISLSLGGKC